MTKPAAIMYGRETKDDGTWRADLFEDNGRWTFQRYKATPGVGNGWVLMGEPKTFSDKDVAKQTLSRLGYVRIV